MSEPKRTELSVAAERTLLVTVVLPGSNVDPLDPLGEIRSLAKTAGANVVDEMLCKRKFIHPGLYVGTGKAQEIADRAVMNDVNTIVFDNDLSPAQIRDLEELTGRKVLDRSELILDIFALHARTAESRLQVELAQLEYTYPRLLHMWSHLERVAGGATTAAAAVGGIGTRGPGEKQLEIDRRIVNKRVSQLKRKIAEIDSRKVRAVNSRKDTFCVCLVGYTNAGKSTLMNRLTGADAFVADMLFATLDTKTRHWQLADGQEALLSDTVGFVRDLPHHLVASFRATLEEAIGADLLLHVADASHDRVQHEIAAVDKVLKELGCADNKRILLLNKMDRVLDPTVRVVLEQKYPGALYISAATGDGVEKLIQRVTTEAAGGSVRVTLKANCSNGRLMQFIARHGKIREQSFDDSYARIDAVFAVNQLAGLDSFGDDVSVLSRQD